MAKAVIAAVDAGHWMKSESTGRVMRDGKLVVPPSLCRKCAEPFPCSTVLAARASDARDRLAARGQSPAPIAAVAAPVAVSVPSAA